MEKKSIFQEVLNLEFLCQDVSRFLWNNPELGGYEEKSANYLREVLNNEGFKVVNNNKLEHAFYAEFGTGKPVVGILGEFDALPGMSQSVNTEVDPVIEGAPGHGCSHNLIGSSCVAATVALKNIIEKEKIKGTIRFYGCPEEELLCGKTKMIKEHMFDDCDIALSWHPNFANKVHENNFLANASVRFHFTGKSSHAGASPERGRSALDAVELMSVGCNYLREHIIDKARVHYSTDCYGCPPNIVPPKASAWYYVRAPHMTDVNEILERLFDIAKGAALMTGTQVEIDVQNGCCELKSSKAFADIIYDNMLLANLPVYTEEEKEFIKKLQPTFNQGLIETQRKLFNEPESGIHLQVGTRDIGNKISATASSDVGDVSQIIPTGFFTTATWPFGCVAHVWQVTSISGSSIGEKGALYAAQILAGTVYDFLTNNENVERVTKEFEYTKNALYKPMVNI